LLGEGIDHYVDTAEEGTILMPRATAGTAVPVIRNAPGPAIWCNRNVEVSGFTVEDPAGIGILAALGGSVRITRNTVSGTFAGNNGIYVASTGPADVLDAQIHDNVIFNCGHDGIGIRADGAGFNVGLSNNTVSNCIGLAGISFVAGECDGTIDISGNTSNNNNSGSDWTCGIDIQTDGVLTGTIANNTTNGNDLDGIAVVAGYLAASDINLDVTGNTANNNGQGGIAISQDAGTMTATLSGNTLQDNELGLYIYATNAAASLDVLSNTMSGTTVGHGLSVFAPQLNATISGNTVENNATEGCSLGTTVGGTGGDVTFSSNYLSGNNGGSSEFSAAHAGSGAFTLRMGDNTSTNTPPPANYQLFNAGTGTFNFIDEGGNVGTFSGP
jgi:hypothetical protein